MVKLRPWRLSETGRVVNRAPNPEEIALFKPWLMEELQFVAPRMVVTLGNTPLQAFLGEEARVGALHGQLLRSNTGFLLFSLYHPAATIYKPALTAVYEDDLKKLKTYLKDYAQ